MKEKAVFFFKKYYIYILIILGLLILKVVNKVTGIYKEKQVVEKQKADIESQKKLTKLSKKGFTIKNGLIFIDGPNQLNFVESTGIDTANFYKTFSYYKFYTMKDPNSDFEVAFEDMEFSENISYNKALDTLLNSLGNSASFRLKTKTVNPKYINFNNKRIYECGFLIKNKKFRLLASGIIQEPFVGLLYSISPEEYYKIQDSIIYKSSIIYTFKNNSKKNTQPAEISEGKNIDKEIEEIFNLDENLKKTIFIGRASKYNVAVGETFELIYKLNSKGENFVGSSFKEFDVEGPYQSSISNYKNGKLSQIGSFHYVLTAKKEGTIIINSASITSQNKKIESNPITIVVKGKF